MFDLDPLLYRTPGTRLSNLDAHGSPTRTVVGVIVLDTNQLEYAQPPDGPLLAMLQTIAGPAGHELCLPEMALEEHLAHYRSKMDDAVREYAAASQELRRLIRYLTLPPIPMVNVGNAVKDREQRLLEVLQAAGVRQRGDPGRVPARIAALPAFRPAPRL